MMDRLKEERIKQKIQEFIIRIHDYEDIKEDEIVINPFLAGALKLNKKKDIIKFFLIQRLQRGIVTSFGTLLQEIAKILDSDANIEDIDLLVKKDGLDHYIQLKSGPEGFTRPALRKTKGAFEKLKQSNPKAVTVIAFCYGEKEQLSAIWGEEVYESADKVLIGKEFWNYFFGKDCYDKLLNIFRTVKIGKEGKHRLTIKRKSFDEIFKVVYKRILASS